MRLHKSCEKPRGPTSPRGCRAHRQCGPDPCRSVPADGLRKETKQEALQKDAEWGTPARSMAASARRCISGAGQRVRGVKDAFRVATKRIPSPSRPARPLNSLALRGTGGTPGSSRVGRLTPCSQRPGFSAPCHFCAQNVSPERRGCFLTALSWGGTREKPLPTALGTPESLMRTRPRDRTRKRSAPLIPSPLHGIEFSTGRPNFQTELAEFVFVPPLAFPELWIGTCTSFKNSSAVASSESPPRTPSRPGFSSRSRRSCFRRLNFQSGACGGSSSPWQRAFPLPACWRGPTNSLPTASSGTRPTPSLRPTRRRPARLLAERPSGKHSWLERWSPWPLWGGSRLCTSLTRRPPRTWPFFRFGW